MKLTFFDPVTNYPEALRKIAGCSFFVSLICITILRLNILEVDGFLISILPDIAIVSGVNLPIVSILLAVLFAALSNMIKLHDKLSDLFGIRKYFDANHILIPLLRGSGAKIPKGRLSMLKREQNRSMLMNTCFYRFASSGKPDIDPHLIHMALDQWSWYWVLLESAFIVFASCVIAILANKTQLVGTFLIILFSLLWLMQYLWKSCISYASNEVQAILEDKERKAFVRKEFDAL